MSRTVHHGRPDGAWIDVTSHRPDDFEDRKTWLPTNTLLRAVRHEVGVTNPREHNAAADRLAREAADGTIPWTAATITVDGAPVAFDVMRYQTQWVGIAEIAEVFVMLDSSAVALSDVHLVSRAAH